MVSEALPLQVIDAVS